MENLRAATAACQAISQRFQHIDVAMRNRRLGPQVETTWGNLRYELNTLARVYNLPPVGFSSR